MKISEIKQRLSTAGSFNAIIGNYIYAFLTARPFTPGYDLIGEGEGISNLGNYNDETKTEFDFSRYATNVMYRLFKNDYARVPFPTEDMMKLFNDRVYANPNYMTFDNFYKYSIDSIPKYKKEFDDIDAHPVDLLDSYSKLVEKRDTYYKSHILSVNITPEYMYPFVDILFDELRHLNAAINKQNKLHRIFRPKIRLHVQIPKTKNVNKNEKDTVTIMCSTRDLEQAFNLINNTFDRIKIDKSVLRKKPNPLLANPYNYIAYDSYDTELCRTESEIIGEIVVEAIDMIIEKYNKKLPVQQTDDKTKYRQDCINILMLQNKNKYIKEIMKNVKIVMGQKRQSRWKDKLSYDIDPNMLFVAPRLRDSINHVYSRKNKYKVLGSMPYNHLDDEQKRKIRFHF